MTAARTNPNGFCREVLRDPNDEWQAEVMDAVADVERKRRGEPTVVNHGGLSKISVVSCHGPGKTFLGAKLAHWWQFPAEGRVVVTGPKLESITTRLWPAFLTVMSKADPEYRKLIEVAATRIRWGGKPTHFAQAESARNSENLQGHHHPRLLFIVDEASGVAQSMFQAVEGALTEEGAILVLIGNGTRGEGEFYESHEQPKVAREYWRRSVSYLDSPRVSRRWAERMIQRYGAESPVVRVRVLGKFPGANPDQLIVMSWLSDALERRTAGDGSHPERRVTVDVADGGEDFTVCTAAEIYDNVTRVRRQLQYSFPPAEAPISSADAAEALAVEIWGDPAVPDYVVDSIGVGAGTAGALIKRNRRVVRYTGGSASDDVKRWRNRRVQSYMVLRDRLRDGLVAFDEGALYDAEHVATLNDDDRPEDELLAQACSVRRVIGVERVEDLETKEAMKRRGVKSPDRADSLAMIFATQAPTVASAGFAEPVMVGAELEGVGADW